MGIDEIWIMGIRTWLEVLVFYSTVEFTITYHVFYEWVDERSLKAPSIDL